MDEEKIPVSAFISAPQAMIQLTKEFGHTPDHIHTVDDPSIAWPLGTADWLKSAYVFACCNAEYLADSGIHVVHKDAHATVIVSLN